MEALAKRFERDFSQALVEDDPGEYELPVAKRPDLAGSLSEIYPGFVTLKGDT